MVRSRLVLEETTKMAARRQSKVTLKYKTKYRVRNWAAYEESLRRRGDITIWFDDDAVASWNAGASGRPGGQQEYSDLAILTSWCPKTRSWSPSIDQERAENCRISTEEAAGWPGTVPYRTMGIEPG